jgi:hypothetical protein
MGICPEIFCKSNKWNHSYLGKSNSVISILREALLGLQDVNRVSGLQDR